MERTINNNLEDWKMLKIFIERELIHETPPEERFLQINVIVEDNIENLVYCFPIVDSARILKWKCSINIKVNKNNTRLISSVSHFLCVQSIIREGLTITINNKPLDNQTRFGKIQPVIAVTNRLGSFCYQHLFKPQISFDLIFELKPVLISLIIYNDYNIDNIKKLNSIISKNADIISPSFVLTINNILNESQPTKINWSELFEVQQSNNINIIICKFIISNIVYMTENITGDSQNKLSLEKKEKIANKLFEYFRVLVQEIPLLSLYIWSILMRFLLVKKELIRHDADLFEPVMETTANRAISFGEGLYQLIENSCFHSCTKNGYFYLRVYGKSKSNSLKEEEKHIKSLRTLANRYDSYKISKDIDLYFEFCFIDSTFDGRKIYGMIDHYNLTHKNKAANSLIELFNSQPDTEDDLTEHYGLRFFQRTVSNNQGAFCVSTPNNQSVDEGLIFRMAKGEKIKENKGNVYNGTVYHVVFPLILD